MRTRIGFRIYLILPIAAFLSACQTVDFGTRSYAGQAPLQLRDKQIAQKKYYIEARGNGFASYEMLTEFFQERARLLCAGQPKSLLPTRGTTVPDGTLPGIRIDACYNGGFCQADNARAPLVFGQVECN